MGQVDRQQVGEIASLAFSVYWPQLRRCLLFRARTQAYLEKG